MSIIRSLSNPEGIYAYIDRGRVQLYHSVPKPLASGRFMSMPRHVLKHVCRRWPEADDDVTFRGLTVKFLPLNLTTGARARVSTMDGSAAEGFRVRLQYQDDYVHMWEVTWNCIVEDMNARD